MRKGAKRLNYADRQRIESMKKSGAKVTEIEGDLKDGKYNLGDNTLLASHLLNVAVEINMNDSRMKPVKIEKRMRIDGAVSVFDAMTMVSKYHSEIGKKLLNEAA